MKRIIICLSLSLYSIVIYGQVLNQDADGNSALVWSGGGLGVDITQALVKLNYYSPTEGINGKMWGMDIQGKSGAGFSNFFSKDNFTPDSKISGLFGCFGSSKPPQNPQIIEIEKVKDFDNRFKNSIIYNFHECCGTPEESSKRDHKMCKIKNLRKMLMKDIYKNNEHLEFIIDTDKYYQNSKGETLLMKFVHEGDIEMVNKLIEFQCDLDLQKKDGWTALMMATRNSSKGNTEKIVEILINTGCNLDLQERDGWTAVMIASRNSNKDSTAFI